MTHQEKQALRESLKKRFPGAYVAKPRPAKAMANFNRMLDAIQSLIPVSEETAEAMIKDQVMQEVGKKTRERLSQE